MTPQRFSQTSEVVSRVTAISWLRFGFNALPLDLAMQPYSAEYACTALVYEFEKVDVQSETNVTVPGRLSADVHLEKSGISQWLN
ncbi:MAG TPA: hypothetical protein VE422_25270 [Terriglobia bacterium]|nr:hypothetical protein [Terriglobia bacterium]